MAYFACCAYLQNDLHWLLCRCLPCLDTFGLASARGSVRGRPSMVTPPGRRATHVEMRPVVSLSPVQTEWSSARFCTKPGSDESSSSRVIEKAVKVKATHQWTTKATPIEMKPTKSTKKCRIAHLWRLDETSVPCISWISKSTQQLCLKRVDYRVYMSYIFYALRLLMSSSSRTNEGVSASDCCALQEALYKFIDTIQYNTSAIHKYMYIWIYEVT